MGIPSGSFRHCKFDQNFLNSILLLFLNIQRAPTWGVPELFRVFSSNGQQLIDDMQG